MVGRRGAVEDGVASALAEAATDMAAQPDVAATLDSICTHAVSSIGADSSGILLLRNRRITIAALSDPEIALAEDAQTETGQGPCLETVRRSETFCVPDMRQEPRWPDWSARMVTLGWLSALSVRLTDGSRTIGSLNLFSRAANAFDEHDIEVAHIFARHASIALKAAKEEETLHQAISARHLVGVAQGILMERYQIDVTTAFEVMKRHSQQNNVKLHRIAAHVVQHRELPTSPVAVPAV
jgi:GAF domain-containing protein